MKRANALPIAIALLALAGCGSSKSSSSSASSSSSSSAPAASSSAPAGAPAGTAGKGAGASGTVGVTMKNLAFVPATVSAKVGQTVRWVNDDTPPHNVTWVSGPKFASSSTLDTGAKFQITLTQPGTIHYVCTIHPFMKGTILVTR